MRSTPLFLIGLAVSVIAVPAYAAFDYNVQCMQVALERRESQYLSAFDNYNFTVRNAMITQKNSLSFALTIENDSARRDAIRSAKKVYKDTERAAARTRRDAERNARRAFDTDEENCEL